MFMHSHGRVAKVPRTAVSKDNLLKAQKQYILTCGKSYRRLAWIKREHTEGEEVRDGLPGRKKEIT